VVHSGVSEARNVIALFFRLGWDRYGFDKNHARTHYNELVFLLWGTKCHRTTFNARVRPVRIQQKAHRDTLWQTCFFLHPVGSAALVVHSSVFGWDRYGFGKKCTRTRYTKLVFLHPVGYVGRVVQSIASGA
jgi:hypothetical protein